MKMLLKWSVCMAPFFVRMWSTFPKYDKGRRNQTGPKQTQTESFSHTNRSHRLHPLIFQSFWEVSCVQRGFSGFWPFSGANVKKKKKNMKACLMFVYISCPLLLWRRMAWYHWPVPVCVCVSAYVCGCVCVCDLDTYRESYTIWPLSAVKNRVSHSFCANHFKAY